MEVSFFSFSFLFFSFFFLSDHELSRIWLEGLDDVMFCYSLKRLPLEERPAKMRERFRLKYPLNDVWKYRSIPRHAYY